MQVVGILCEYNPFHKGHQKQFAQIREQMGEETLILCLMSGNFVQRGQPAIYPKEIRARAALASGADLVLELPVNFALSSAEGFASGGVAIFERLGVCNALAFGCEDPELLSENMPLLLSNDYQESLHAAIREGKSYAAAAKTALEKLGGDGSLLSKPNNILAVEYCKALAAQGSSIKPLALKRDGDYHREESIENPSAEYLRASEDWEGFVPEEALALYRGQAKYRLEYGERAMLSRLRLLTKEDTEKLPYASEGLWNKLLRAIREGKDLNGIMEAAKSKRYPYTRLSRMLLLACLGLRAEDMKKEAEFVRVLAFGEKARPLLRKLSDEGRLPLLHLGQAYEKDASDYFYPLFREGTV